MKFPASDISAMLTAFGDRAEINGQQYPCLFMAEGKLVPLYDGSVMSTGPLLLVDETTAAGVDLNETIIYIEETEYVAISKKDDGAGFVDVSLTKDF